MEDICTRRHQMMSNYRPKSRSKRCVGLSKNIKHIDDRTSDRRTFVMIIMFIY